MAKYDHLDRDLVQQLDLVLARRPHLPRNARKSLRLQGVMEIDVPLPGGIESTQRLPVATRNLRGVFPPGLNPGELAVAQRLDASPLVKWWHRNPRGERDFFFLRELGGKLQSAGLFNVEQLQFP